jgi:hypothetical protein
MFMAVLHVLFLLVVLLPLVVLKYFPSLVLLLVVVSKNPSEFVKILIFLNLALLPRLFIWLGTFAEVDFKIFAQAVGKSVFIGVSKKRELVRFLKKSFVWFFVTDFCTKSN